MVAWVMAEKGEGMTVQRQPGFDLLVEDEFDILMPTPT
jgi:hypothetical protein